MLAPADFETLRRFQAKPKKDADGRYVTVEPVSRGPIRPVNRGRPPHRWRLRDYLVYLVGLVIGAALVYVLTR